MDRRTFSKLAALGLGLPLTAESAAIGKISAKKFPHKKLAWSFSQLGLNAKILCDGVSRNFKVAFIGDAHIAFDDGLLPPYDDYASRMLKGGKHSVVQLKNALLAAEKNGCSAAILGGDLINFPSEANVQKVKEVMDSSPIACFYTAGNHDWHFEGDGGSDLSQRDNWTKKRLLPLYNGENYLLYFKDICGVRFIVFDDSAYEILPEQLELLKKALSAGLPTIICCHIPFYIPDENVFSIGNPNWREANDPYYKIERRLPWSATGPSKISFDFCETVFNAPNVLGMLAGHKHKLSVQFYRGKFQIVSPKFGKNGEFVEVEFKPFNK